MLIKQLNSLTDEEVNQIRQVESKCKEHEGLSGSMYLDTSLNFNKDIKNVYLLYEDSRLVSVISMFIPTPQEAEVSAYTLPEYRNKGYFSKLLSLAVKELKQYNIPDILFVCESKSLSGKEAINSLNVSYDFTEYLLKYRKPDNSRIENHNYRITLHTSGMEDLEAIINMSMQIYKDSYEDAKGFVVNALQAKDRKQYTAMLDNQFIGMGAVSMEQGEAMIYGLGIIPECQGKGLGRELLYLIIKELLGQGCGSIGLEVDSKNDRAFKLYLDSGFEIETAFDYYRKKMLILKS